jgi:sulfite exporter TauE/SafE
MDETLMMMALGAGAIGLFGSLHCAGMCGPLVLALPHTEQTPLKAFSGHLIYHLGRVSTYIVFGIAAGLAGKAIVFAGFQKWVSILTGVAIILFALQTVTGFSPLGKAGAAGTPGLKFVSRWFKHFYARSRFMAGAVNGLLPCGFVYVGVAGALNQPDITGSAVYMASFGAGTIPMMMLVGLSPRLIPAKIRLRLAGALPYCAILLGVLFVLRGMELNIPFISPVIKVMCCH